MPHREIFHFSFFSLQESVKLEIWLFLVEKNHLGIDILPGRVVEVIQEVADADEGDIAADQDKLLVIRSLTQILIRIRLLNHFYDIKYL